MPNADVAWVDVLPSARNFLPKLQQAVDPAARAAGTSAGRQFGTSFGASSTNGVEAASAKMSAALRKTADAAGQVRVAEQRLIELRQSGKATSSQVAAAEERLASARRKETGANHELASATTRVRTAQEQATNATRTGSSAMDDSNRKAGILTRTFGGMRGAVATGFAAFYGAQTAVNFIGGAIAASRDLNETINKATVIFGENMGVVDAWARGASKSVGLSRAAALEAASGFGNMYTQLGFSAEAAAQMSVKTVQMSADLGSFNNLPTAEVAEMVSAAFRGEYDSLQRLIPNISAARVEQEAMTMTGKASTEQLTAQEKAAAVLAIVQRDGAAAMGDFARTSGGLANSQKILSATWDDAKAKLGALLVGPATGFVKFLIDAIPRVQAFGGWLRENAQSIGIAAGALGALVLVTKAHGTALAISAAGGMAQWATQAKGISAITKAWAAVQWILNASVMGFPLVWIAAALAAVGAAVVLLWQRSETFRNIVQAAFRVVGDAASWLWRAIQSAWASIRSAWDASVDAAQVMWRALQSAFDAVGRAWRAVLDGVQWAWQNILKPTWDFVVNAAGDLRDILKILVFGPIVIAWKLLTEAVQLAWRAVLKPVWEAIQAAALFMWNSVLRPTWAAIQAAWAALLSAVRTVYNSVLVPTWNALSALARWLWERILQPIWSAMQAAWERMLGGFRRMYETILVPTWNALRSAAEFLWTRVLQPTWDAMRGAWDGLMRGVRRVYDAVVAPMWDLIRTAVDGVKRAWSTAVDGIKSAWDRIKGIAAAPINFVVRTVLRDGLFKAWNWLLDKLGITSWKIDLGSSWLQGIPGYATGGQIAGHSPSPRADNIPIWATAGEFMVQQRIASRTTPFLSALNAGHPAALDLAQQYEQVARHYASGGQIFAVTRNAFPRAKVNSTYRPGDPGFHGRDQAADMGEAGYPGGAGRPYIAAMKNWWVGNYGRTAAEIIYNGIGNAVSNIKNGASYAYSALTQSQHRNHLHVAYPAALSGATGSPRGGTGTIPKSAATIDRPWYADLWSTVSGAADWLKSKISAVGQMASRFGNSPLVGWLKEMPGMLVGKAFDKVKGTIGSLLTAFVSNGQDVAPGASSGAVQDVVRAAAGMPQYGWGSGAQWDALARLIQGESSWNPRAQNPTSSASGLFQHIRSTWLAYRPVGVTAGRMADARVAEQAQAGMNYIKQVYGSPLRAYQMWSARAPHWYAGGGEILPVFHGGGHTRGWRTDAMAVLGPDERVLSAGQDDYFRRLVDATSTEGGGVGGKRQMAEQMHFHQQPGESSQAFADRLWHKFRVADRGGVFANSMGG